MAERGSKAMKRKLRSCTRNKCLKVDLPAVDLTRLSDSFSFPHDPLEIINISDDEEDEPTPSHSHSGASSSVLSSAQYDRIQTYINSIPTEVASDRRVDFNKGSIPSTSREQFNHPGPKDLTAEELHQLLSNIDQSTPKTSNIVEKRTYKPTPPKKISEEDVMAYVDSITDVNTDELRKQIEEKNILLYQTNVPVSTLTNENFHATVPDLLTDCSVDIIQEDIPSSKDSPKNNKSSGVQQECPVCLETFSGDISVMATKCGHVYCGDCMKRILKTSKKCPSCRSKLNNNKVFPIFIFN